MGKNKKTKRDGEQRSQHCAATVFVGGLPYSFTNSQLEETFSDVGPVRLCFMVTNKGSNEHRGFGFVKFALVEDANKAIELKNGSTVGQRKITVKLAAHRAPLEQRRAKAAEGVQSVDKSETKVEKEDSVIPETDKLAVKPVLASEKTPEKPVARKRPAKLSVNLTEKEAGSEKQRVARTVIFGGLLDAATADIVHECAKDIGTVCSVRYPLPKEELQQNGLSQDGCRADASAVLFTSVKSACSAVAALHQKEIKGNMIWARQLGGEGSKAQKWKLIIRNLPFKAKASEIKEAFSASGFVWDVYVPKNPQTGLPKGFAFVKFTCKKDAEKAIQKFNGYMFNKRTIAVDWAIPKKLYNAAADVSADSEKGQDRESDMDSDYSSEDTEEVDDDNDDDDDGNTESVDMDTLKQEGGASDVNFEEEADVARKVLKNLLASSKDPIAEESDKNKDSSIESLADASDVSEPSKSVETTVPKAKEGNENLQRTLFINNLPFDVTKEEVTQRFAGFGEIESFFPVLHPLTKRPRGTGFLRFKTEEAADAAIAGANTTSGAGIVLKGRQLIVLRALDKQSANEKEHEKTKEQNHDHRNLYLAKEGLILDGTVPAESVSAEDMEKRRRLHENKMKKLQSPNFHVSRTRIVIYNLPKSMTEKQLKKLCVDAVTSRATKQTPSIRQIKFLKNEKNGKIDTKNYSRGVAFVEFTDHQHALVALRVLNNNPETFGQQHRPIVEFAVDNVQKLKIRKAKQQFQQMDRGVDESSEVLQPNAEPTTPKIHFEKDSKKRKTSEAAKPAENTKKTKKMKAAPVRGEVKEASKPVEKTVGGELQKQQKKKAETKMLSLNNKPKRSEETSRKRKIGEEERGEEERSKGQKKKKNKQGSGGGDTVDKLDMLIEQYRSKFSQSSGKSERGNSKSLGQVRRWFQS